MFYKIAFLALAGAAGTLLRYGLAGVVQRIQGTSFPWGTLLVNLSGCFLAGLFWALFESKWPVSPETRTVIMVGFMGAFTTFSAFILESGELMRSAEWMSTFANLAAQNVFGFLALFAGFALARVL
jgi:CrcB protein